jgi:hypothetical protein
VYERRRGGTTQSAATGLNDACTSDAVSAADALRKHLWEGLTLPPESPVEPQPGEEEVLDLDLEIVALLAEFERVMNQDLSPLPRAECAEAPSPTPSPSRE